MRVSSLADVFRDAIGRAPCEDFATACMGPVLYARHIIRSVGGRWRGTEALHFRSPKELTKSDVIPQLP